MMANYHELATPVDAEIGNERIRAFYADLGKIREKHSIPDVHVVAMIPIKTENGSAPALLSIHYGDEMQAMKMCSFALGHASGEHQKFILAARSQGMKLGAELALKKAKKRHDDLFDDLEG